MVSKPSGQSCCPMGLDLRQRAGGCSAFPWAISLLSAGGRGISIDCIAHPVGIPERVASYGRWRGHSASQGVQPITNTLLAGGVLLGVRHVLLHHAIAIAFRAGLETVALAGSLHRGKPLRWIGRRAGRQRHDEQQTKQN